MRLKFTANNYLTSTQIGQDTSVYSYDIQGNMLTMPYLSSMDWDYSGNLKKSTFGTVNIWYCYDMQGVRVRKVTEKQGGIKEERIYLNGYEVYRKHISGVLDLERQSLNILDVKQVEEGEGDEKQIKFEYDYNKKIALVETKTVENGEEITTPTSLIRYQYDNHLGSACLELDALAAIVSYEEYHPFGTTSYRSGRTETEVSLKRYKYVGKERDEETGLYYYGARYYAAWICRFVSVDPLQYKYPYYTPYQYAGNKPITYIDLDGLEEVMNLVSFFNRFIKGKNLIFKSTSNKESSDTETFGRFAANLKEEYLANTKNKSIPSVTKVNTGNDVVKYINMQKSNSIKTLDIISHSSQEGIFFKESEGGKSKHNLYTSLLIEYKNNALFNGNSKNLSDILYDKFTIDAIVEIHGCAVAGYFDAEKGSMYTDDNFAIEFSKKLYSSGKVFGVVIAHYHKSGPDENNDFRQNTRVVYYNGKVLFSTTQKGAISQEQILSAIIKFKQIN